MKIKLWFAGRVWGYFFFTPAVGTLSLLPTCNNFFHATLFASRNVTVKAILQQGSFRRLGWSFNFRNFVNLTSKVISMQISTKLTKGHHGQVGKGAGLATNQRDFKSRRRQTFFFEAFFFIFFYQRTTPQAHQHFEQFVTLMWPAFHAFPGPNLHIRTRGIPGGHLYGVSFITIFHAGCANLFECSRPNDVEYIWLLDVGPRFFFGRHVCSHTQICLELWAVDPERHTTCSGWQECVSLSGFGTAGKLPLSADEKYGPPIRLINWS